MAHRAFTPGPSTPPKGQSLVSRASIEGMEVLDSSFDHWLESGGERRRRPREAGSAADRGRVEVDNSLDATGWDRLGGVLLKD